MSRPGVLITRPRVDAQPLADALAAAGFEPVIEPMMEVVIRHGPPLDWDGVQAVALTSANGARALASRERRRDLTVFAVGDATARAARDLGFRTVISAGGDVETLTGVIIAHLDPAAGAVRHVSGETVAGDLCGRLRGAGFSCVRDRLYEARTVAALSASTTRRMTEGDLAAVMLFSPRTAELFVACAEAAGLSGRCGRLEALCLSDRVARVARQLPWRHISVAARPDQAALISTAIDRLARL